MFCLRRLYRVNLLGSTISIVLISRNGYLIAVVPLNVCAVFEFRIEKLRIYLIVLGRKRVLNFSYTIRYFLAQHCD